MFTRIRSCLIYSQAPSSVIVIKSMESKLSYPVVGSYFALTPEFSNESG